jgi:hypothetical protein
MPSYWSYPHEFLEHFLVEPLILFVSVYDTCGCCQGRIARITVRYDTACVYGYSFILEVIMDESVTTGRVYQDGAPHVSNGALGHSAKTSFWYKNQVKLL